MVSALPATILLKYLFYQNFGGFLPVTWNPWGALKKSWRNLCVFWHEGCSSANYRISKIEENWDEASPWTLKPPIRGTVAGARFGAGR
jgi:hypothetical protein